jgi:hypothetical protein
MMADTRHDTAARAFSLNEAAALMCSDVHPLDPPADPRGTA